MTKMSKHSMFCAGIDTGKHKLDVALDKSPEQLQIENNPEGHKSLSAWLRQRRVQRIGIEASGGYEQAVVTALRRDGFVVLLFQPAQVRAYARFSRQLAKNDRIDAALIAACTAATKTIHAAPDPRLAAFAGHLTMIEQIADDIARLKTRCESCRDRRILQCWKQEIVRFRALKRSEFKRLLAAIREHGDLAELLDLMVSVEGVAIKTAVSVLVRMPEIGSLSREKAAALVGLAPYDDDSGKRTGERHIAGGRERLRTALYAAALPAAFKWNPTLIALYRRLTANGKPHKKALVACARKLIVFLNTVVARRTPWIPKTADI
jgi:transposase